ncbi:MAG: Uncharacterized protein CEN89_284 [Candidatus Berkelbacteria bacterium Licking1014_7]|uniref:Threonine synthase n=1 Tax=Candidatus Berkelbacteria bacterium Licking1014_7 TaxID=2017147 RepID=A0A554LJL9_9BACT|nr:MAG: Uncharacterized protein CEN89_284 [Candidatus Berkelbacteria bacterium Licking1014_7]
MFNERNLRQFGERDNLQREIKKQIEYPRFMSYGLVEKWGDEIPRYAEADPDAPEWRATPVKPLDFSQEGYGKVYVKDESDRTSNPTGTIKDRAAWELATLYRDYARALYLKIHRAQTLTKGELEKIPIPYLSVITAGNEGLALAECFKKYDLPPPKLVIDFNIKQSILEELLKLRVNIYATDLSLRLSGSEICRIADNVDGIDITSSRAIDPASVFYDWHVHEVFNEEPDEIYLPYGSGRLMENYLFWQARSMRNDAAGVPDPRLKADVAKVISINILGAEPARLDSKADKATAKFKPFLLFQDRDIKSMVNLAFTGKNTIKQPLNEDRVIEAYESLTARGVEAEPTAALGLGLYFERFSQGLVPESKKVFIINTGKGLI